MTISTRLGPFHLEDRIGEGGMGVVYRGEHTGTGVPVAIKAIRRASDEESRRQFHEEVQAHAGLQHPGVVYLFEYGRVDATAAEDSGGELREGDPFVAMELADRGTVRDLMPVRDWEGVCRILVQVLDALAYSHARGVIHRDLKPENLLIFGDDGQGSGAWQVKLADFGIAHAFGGEHEVTTEHLEVAAGTPYYMAPEQFRGEWWRSGPWTDLYALGCIAWELVCGRPPFDGNSTFDITLKHQREPRPSLDPQFPVPDELESWIHRAMTVDPQRRFRRAADAAWALPRAVLAAGGAETEPTEETTDRTSQSPDAPSLDNGAATVTEDLASTLLLSEPDSTARAETLAADRAPSPDRDTKHGTDEPPPDQPADLLEDFHPPVPDDWQPAQTDSLPAPLVGTGLGLFGLREPPFVDRHEECDHIWQRLREVVRQRTARTVFLSGEAGTGKSRLAEWMATRAHEVGAVRVVRAVHTSGGGQHEGLRGALERTLRTVKMDRGELFEHLRETLPALEDHDDQWRDRDARALTEYLRPTDDASEPVDGPRYRFSRPAQKHALLERILRRLAGRRPLLLWLDDLQWGSEGVDMLEHLARLDRDPPAMLVVATLRSDLVRRRPELRERLEALTDADGSTELTIAPLERTYQRDLLVDLLPLEDGLADRLADRTEGHPLFAMQLLDHWIEQEAIEVGDDGFRIAADRPPELPEDIHHLWGERLDRLVESIPAESPTVVRHAIERAAALGRDVDAREWRALCDALELARPDALRDRLVERGLARRTESGWSFAHGLLVDSLERQAREAGRWRRHHARCSDLLEELYRDRPRRTAGRRARHRIEADQPERALEPLLAEARRLWELGDIERMSTILEQRRDLLEQLDIPETDPRCVENDLGHFRVQSMMGSPDDELQEAIASIRRRAEQSDDPRIRARAWHTVAHHRTTDGRLDTAREAAEEATRWARRCENDEPLVDALLQWGWSAFLAGRLDEARQRLTGAHRRAAGCHASYGRLMTRRNLAWLALTRGDRARAADLFERTLEQSREAGFRSIEGKCLNGLAAIATVDGDADEARRRCRQYEDLGRELDAPKIVVNARQNLIQVELMEGRFADAEHRLEALERQFDELSLEARKPRVFELIQLILAAGHRNWQTFDQHWSSLDDWPEGARLLDDHAWLLEMAADYAAEAGEDARAADVWRLARDLWRRLDDEEARQRVAGKLDG